MFFKDTSAEKDINTEKETLEVASLREENYKMPVQRTRNTPKKQNIS